MLQSHAPQRISHDGNRPGDSVIDCNGMHHDAGHCRGIIATGAPMMGIAADIARAAAGAVRGIARFYGQPDGWPLKIEAVYGANGWILLKLDFQRRREHLLRAECPAKIRRRFGDCNKVQWIAFPVSMQLDAASRSGYAYILWSDQRNRGWQQLPPAKLAELDLEA